MLWSEELAAIRAIKAARGDEADVGIRGLWWVIACIASAMIWIAILAAFG